MTTAEERKAERKVIEQIILTMKLEDIDYLSLPRPLQMAIISVFQLGVGFMQRYGEELTKRKELIEQPKT